MISWLHFAIAAVPVAMYLIMIGCFKFRSRPLITSGWRDSMALGIAISGMVFVGPVELFFPKEAAALWNGWVWLALASLYLLTMTLFLLSSRPRLLAYGLNAGQFRQTLLLAAQSVDPSADWQGEVLTLPAVGIQLAIEPTGVGRVQQVVCVGNFTNFAGWLELEHAFVQAGKNLSCPRSHASVFIVASGILLMLVALGPLVATPNNALAQLREYFTR